MLDAELLRGFRWTLRAEMHLDPTRLVVEAPVPAAGADSGRRAEGGKRILFFVRGPTFGSRRTERQVCSKNVRTRSFVEHDTDKM